MTTLIPMRRCCCTAGSKVGLPARCATDTDHPSGYCDECRYRCCDLQRHNIDHSRSSPKDAGGVPPRPMDSFETIKELLSRRPEPTPREALEIYDALHDVYWRLMKVRAVAPRTDYSATLWRLLGLAGFPDRSLENTEGRRP